MLFPIRRASDVKSAARKLVQAVTPKDPPPHGQAIHIDYPVHPRARPWKNVLGMRRLEGQFRACLPSAALLLQRILELQENLLAISPHPDPKRPGAPQWINPMFPALDAAVLYGLLALRNPRWYVEVGSGYSTCFARRAIQDLGLRTRIISIDPCPRAEIDALCDQVIRVPLEELQLSEVTDLTKEDLLFVDSSHRTFQNSDVTVFFLEILPSLPPGLAYGLHDIFLPADYPDAWADRFYSEQYLLASYLNGGGDGDEVLLPHAYLCMETELPRLFEPLFDRLDLPAENRVGSAFWLRRHPQRF